MEIYRALSDFTPPDTPGSQSILSFSKGDKFEIFDCHKQTEWWGARSLKNNAVGYVPCKYLQHEERKIGKIIPVSEEQNEHKEKALQRFADMQNHIDHKHPDFACPQTPETPVPDYDLDFPNEIDAEIPEPAPDYLDDDSTDDKLPPPPPGLDRGDGDDTLPINGQSFHLHPHPQPRPPSFTEADIDDSFIRPKKLNNPCVESRERQALHRELLMNYKLGKDVLQKSELNKKLMDRRQTQKKKEWEEQMSNKRSSFEMKLEERAHKLKEDEEKSLKPIQETTEGKPELLKIHARITHKH